MAVMRSGRSPERRIRLDLGRTNDKGEKAGAGRVLRRDGKLFVEGKFNAPYGFTDSGSLARPVSVVVDVEKHSAADDATKLYLDAMGHESWDRTTEAPDHEAAYIGWMRDLSSNSVKFHMVADVRQISAENGREAAERMAVRGQAPITNMDRMTVYAEPVVMDGSRESLDGYARSAAQMYMFGPGAARSRYDGRDIVNEGDYVEGYNRMLGTLDRFFEKHADKLGSLGVTVWHDCADGHMKAGIPNMQSYRGSGESRGKEINDLLRAHIREELAEDRAARNGEPMSNVDRIAQSALMGLSLKPNNGRMTPVLQLSCQATPQAIERAYQAAYNQPVNDMDRGFTCTPADEVYSLYHTDMANRIRHDLDDTFPSTVRTLPPMGASIDLRGNNLVRGVPGLDYTDTVRNMGVCSVRDIRDHFNTRAREFSLAAEKAGMLPACLEIRQDGRLALKDVSVRNDPDMMQSLRQFGSEMNHYLATKGFSATHVYGDDGKRMDYLEKRALVGQASYMEFDPSKSSPPTQELFEFCDLAQPECVITMDRAKPEPVFEADKQRCEGAYTRMLFRMVGQGPNYNPKPDLDGPEL